MSPVPRIAETSVLASQTATEPANSTAPKPRAASSAAPEPPSSL
jgi:hypothetical protein